MNNSNRCGWAKGEKDILYHDTEWGVPSHDDGYIFEMLILEGFQAGLSWNIILQKRENFREAFDNFDYKKIAEYDATKLSELLKNEGIIRNRLKINSTVTNAIAFMKVQKEFGSFAKYIWNFTDNKRIINGLDKPFTISCQLSKRCSMSCCCIMAIIGVPEGV